MISGLLARISPWHLDVCTTGPRDDVRLLGPGVNSVVSSLPVEALHGGELVIWRQMRRLARAPLKRDVARLKLRIHD